MDDQDYRLSDPEYRPPIFEEAELSDPPVCATCAHRWWVLEHKVGPMCICQFGNYKTYPSINLDKCEKWQLAKANP